MTTLQETALHLFIILGPIARQLWTRIRTTPPIADQLLFSNPGAQQEWQIYEALWMSPYFGHTLWRERNIASLIQRVLTAVLIRFSSYRLNISILFPFFPLYRPVINIFNLINKKFIVHLSPAT